MGGLFSIASDYTAAQWLFLKVLALIYAIAFFSLNRQVLALYGKGGIAPISALARLLIKAKRTSLLRHPSLFLYFHRDSHLKWGCLAGIILSLLAFLGFFPTLLFLVLWLLYLSFHQMGSEFLSYQWDTLLLETGFVAIFFSLQTPPPFLMILLLWTLLFRFMFASGAIKFLSRCPAWGKFEAMQYHYETQPIPNRLAYFLHQLPPLFHKVSQGVALVIELLIPFLIFTPEPGPLIAFCSFVLLQLLIGLSGNFAFFNLLSLAIAVPLLPNPYLDFLPPFLIAGQALAPDPYLNGVLSLVAAAMILLNLLQFLDLFLGITLFDPIFRAIAPFRLINSYGLFARMTVERDEIIVQGSDDGVEWKNYEFYYKPGDISRPPPQVAPHQPRLDWQMWFAALSDLRSEPWFLSFLATLLEGSPEVLKLIKGNPFPKPPRYVRALLYRYNFTDCKELKEKGNWWRREYLGIYCPSVTLEDLRP